jgi:GT2 family glycosyltransferase
VWGTSFRQRLRLAPLFGAMVAGDLVSRFLPAARQPRLTPWRPGVSVIIPERDAPAMLADALGALDMALARIAEPHQVIVVVNGATRDHYASIAARHPAVEFMYSEAPLGFAGAIEWGLTRARFDGTFLLNNDMTLDAQALAALLPWRAPDVFAIAAQIFQQDATGRREETGFTDWYVDRGGVHLFHALPKPGMHEHLCASGGAALFRTGRLRHYLPASRCYDPFYWEDAEWGVRAWNDGLRVIFCAEAHAIHRHRSTTARFYAPDELDRIVERNRLLFDARQRGSPNGRSWLMDRICELPYASQRELAHARQAASVFRARARRRGPHPTPPPDIACAEGGAVALQPASYSYRLRQSEPGVRVRPRLLLVTPFAVFPPRHGGARRIAQLLAGLRADYDVVLVSDEASLYDARSFAWLDDLYAVHLVQRPSSRPAGAQPEPALLQRMRSHRHPALVATVAEAIARYEPDVVQIEYAELAALVDLRASGARWVLALHDACSRAEFASEAAANEFQATLDAYDAVTVCSSEDAALTVHRRIACIPNGSVVRNVPYVPSQSLQVLFVGPFRYAPNRDGVLHFLREVWPAVRAGVPSATLVILGGDEHRAFTTHERAFTQAGVTVLGHRDDVPALLTASALTINPLSGIRGSAVKLIESLAAGRICVSTSAGARGFAGSALPSLVTVEDVPAMAGPVIDLLADIGRRHRLEIPSPDLARYGWDRSVELQRSLYDALLHAPAH